MPKNTGRGEGHPVDPWTTDGADRRAARDIHTQARLRRATHPLAVEQVEQLLRIGFRAGTATATEPARRDNLTPDMDPAYGYNGPDRGEMLRTATPPHQCPLPEHGRRGDVWRCGECRRRWTCVDHQTRRGNMVSVRADWRRRYWPWPNTTTESTR